MTLTVLVLVAMLEKHPIIESIKSHPTLKYKSTVLAICYEETGYFKSRRCRRDNNYFGMKKGDHYWVFPSWRSSLDQFAQSQKRFIARHKIRSSTDYYRCLGKYYAPKNKKYTKNLKIIDQKHCSGLF